MSMALGVLNVSVSVISFMGTRALPPQMLRRLQGNIEYTSHRRSCYPARLAINIHVPGMNSIKYEHVCTDRTVFTVSYCNSSCPDVPRLAAAISHTCLLLPSRRGARAEPGRDRSGSRNSSARVLAGLRGALWRKPPHLCRVQLARGGNCCGKVGNGLPQLPHHQPTPAPRQRRCMDPAPHTGSHFVRQPR